MKKIIFLLFFLSAFSTKSYSQLPNGSTAPDFTLLDLNGNWHNLYYYLDQGKTVFIEFFACHCPSCWDYHNTNTLKDLYNSYGPEGTDQIMVLMLEHDEYNGYNEFYGITQGWPTQGDWVTGNPIPIFNVEGGDRTVFDDYQMTFYPLVYMVCPDKTTKVMSTSLTPAELYAEADACPGELSIESIQNNEELIVHQVNDQLIVQGADATSELVLISSVGQIQLRSTGNQLDISSISAGVYFLKIKSGMLEYSRKIYIQKLKSY